MSPPNFTRRSQLIDGLRRAHDWALQKGSDHGWTRSKKLDFDVVEALHNSKDRHQSTYTPTSQGQVDQVCAM